MQIPDLFLNENVVYRYGRWPAMGGFVALDALTASNAQVEFHLDRWLLSFLCMARKKRRRFGNQRICKKLRTRRERGGKKEGVFLNLEMSTKI